MTRTLWIVLALLFVGFFAYARHATGPVPAAASAGDGTGSAALACRLAAPVTGAQPNQTELPAAVQAVRVGRFTLSPLAGFALEARVLGREDYRFDDEAALSPVDLALGWQRMSDPAVYEPLQISQGGRWYRYRWGAGGPPIPLEEIVRSSANMHMVPADDGVAAALAQVEPGQMVQVRGFLIEARRDDGWRWRSSLTREDSGDGSCELILVCSVSSR